MCERLAMIRHLQGELLRHIRNDLTIGHATQIRQAWQINRLRQEVHGTVGINKLYASSVQAGGVVPACASTNTRGTRVVLPDVQARGRESRVERSNRVDTIGYPTNVRPTRRYAIDQVERLLADA